uniref:Uncharacterized protein n=1 Tax=Arundo donax TaxID=35708 RepID=A0A0A8Z658_ARUDO
MWIAIVVWWRFLIQGKLISVLAVEDVNWHCPGSALTNHVLPLFEY